MAVTPEAPSENVDALEKAGAAVITVPAAHGDRVCFRSLMEILGKREITSVLIEGGSEVNASALAAGYRRQGDVFHCPQTHRWAGRTWTDRGCGNPKFDRCGAPPARAVSHRLLNTTF